MNETPTTEKVTIDKWKLENLLKQNEEFKKESEDLRKVAYGICGVLGLTDANGQVKKEYLTGEESPMPAIMKSVMGTITLMTQASVPVIGKKAEAEIAKKFDFIKYLVPIIDKYQK